MATVLFTENKSIYDKLGCNTYNQVKDARTFKGNEPIIAHPPCRTWGKLKHFSKATEEEHNLAILAIDIIRKNGGILEHPATSDLFNTILPKPGKYDEYGGYSICINQNWFGHPAEKKTLLYIKGIQINKLPPIPIKFDRIDYAVGGGINKKDLSKSKRNATPKALALWLIETIKLIENVPVSSIND